MRASRRAQRGVALLGLLAVAVMVFAYVLTSRLNAASMFVGIDRDHNAKVMARAKRALVGWVALNAAGADVNPGRLPCPEAAGYFGDPEQEGIAAGSCTLPAVGRLPWRTLGLEKLVDSAGEPLWYVVSTGWALPCASPPTDPTCKTNINSDSQGQLSFEGTTPVALIIAPGPVLVAQAGTGCTAWSQSRPISGSPNLRNYLECENATADATFVASRAGQTFNDQVLPVMVGDLMPALEAAIAIRAEREIVPVLKAVYSSPLFPYAAPFSNPGPGVGTSTYQGEAGVYQGLLPFNQTQACTEAPANPRCTTATSGPTAFLVFSKYGNDTSTGSGSIRTQSSCSWQSDEYVCTGEYNAPSVAVTFRLNVTNVAMGLRAFDPSRITCSAVDDVGSGLPTQAVGCSATAAIQSNGAALVTVTTSTMPDIVGSGWGTYANYAIRIERAALGDHALLSQSDPTTGWFVRNEWYRLFYYAVAQANTAGSLPSLGCTTNSDCLQLNNPALSFDNRALLILAGRSLTGAARPNGDLEDFVEYQNNDGDTLFEQHPIRMSRIPIPSLYAPWNDRVIVVDRNP